MNDIHIVVDVCVGIDKSSSHVVVTVLLLLMVFVVVIVVRVCVTNIHMVIACVVDIVCHYYVMYNGIANGGCVRRC